jgi:hypothetical protein
MPIEIKGQKPAVKINPQGLRRVVNLKGQVPKITLKGAYTYPPPPGWRKPPPKPPSK